MATLYLILQGTQVVDEKKRTMVDPHYYQGYSYFRTSLALDHNDSEQRLLTDPFLENSNFTRPRASNGIKKTALIIKS